ncbi:MAG TPA: phosphopantetheine-binding protein [Smithellaceae bacterium]|jgi:acyl carrier protein|nr:phosphopantetheine-binding protein [Smithellaceae bacterium]
MKRQDIENELRKIFLRDFEIENPELDANMREAYGFDSIDAIDLLLEIEKYLGSELTQEEKKQAMDIRTMRQIIDYIEKMAARREKATGGR